MDNFGMQPVQPWHWGGLVAGAAWQFPDREHFFITDVHADADALLMSLEATGGTVLIGDDQIELTARGRDAVFVFGGDYFDKGPSNLRVLRVLRRLVDTGARVVLIAGNHDIRTFLGIRHAESSEPTLAHLFVRMGPKAVPLLCEVYRDYVAGTPHELLPEAEIEARLFPPTSWWDEFPELVADLVPAKRLTKEMRRVREKCSELASALAAEGMTMAMAYAAVEKCRELFLSDNGEFSWLFRDMTLAYRVGSFLFAHAGVDDVIARVLRDCGVDELNRWFQHTLEADPFALYNGPIGNVFRTKYRDQDFAFTELGANALLACGVYAIVHGHRNHLSGQNLEVRHGIVHFECDTSLDRNTRRKEGLAGIGKAATIVGRAGVRAYSNDSDAIRVLQRLDVSASAA